MKFGVDDRADTVRGASQNSLDGRHLAGVGTVRRGR
jgi:hypothetical protein